MAKARGIIAWVVAVVTVGLAYFAMDALGDLVGVPISLDVDPFTVDYGRGAETEVSSITTSYGWAVNVLSIAAGVIAWHLVNARWFSVNGTADLLGWLAGSLTMIVGGIPLWNFLREPAWLGNLGELGLLCAAVYAGVNVAKAAKAKKSGSNNIQAGN